jgi:hypothetical protein
MNLFDTLDTRQIETERMPSDEAFRANFLANRTPAVFDDVASRLPIVREWSFDHFASRLDSIRVQRPAEDGLFHYLGFERIPFSQFRESLEANNQAYSFESLIDPKEYRNRDDRGQTAHDERLPGFISMDRLYSSNLWIGSGGNKSLLHFDHVNSLLIMVEGTKRFLLFGPEETDKMYPHSVLDIRSIKEGRVLDSRVNADQIDLEKFPRLRGAKGLHGELQPGQALFIPAGTWHYIESSGLNVAVNYFWFDTPLRYWLQRPLLDYLVKRRIVVAIDQLRKLRHGLERLTHRRAGVSG